MRLCSSPEGETALPLFFLVQDLSLNDPVCLSGLPLAPSPPPPNTFTVGQLEAVPKAPES